MNKILKTLLLFSLLVVGAPQAASQEKMGSLSSDNPVMNYNEGVALYRKDDFKAAKDIFTKALVTENKALETKAEYNIGNSLFKLAKAAEESDPDKAMDALKQAGYYYQKAIDLNPKDLDAKYNHELSQKLLKIIQEKPRPQQQSKNQNKSQEKEKNKEQNQEQTKNQEGQGPENSPDQKQQNGQQEQKKQQDDQQQPESEQEKKKGKDSLSKEEKLSEDEARMLASQFGQENLRLELNHEKNKQQRTISKDW